MSALIGLGPLLDPEALSTIARQLWSARTRLHLRMGGNLPSAAELYLAFQSYMGECDRARMEEQQRRGNTSPAGLVEDGAPDLEMLAHYLAVADAAYARTTEAQKTVLGQLGIDEPLASRLMAETCNPGYLICYDQRRQHLVLSIRGSKEMSDFITNLSAELEEFLTGHGHRGVVRSARGLFHQLLPTLVKYTEVFQPSLFVVVGHSLGAAVASAFTMLLRHVAHMDRSIKRPLRYPKCFAYASPPFLTRRLATHSANCDITTLVTHLDLVPRLCPASVDRLLLKLSQHDWGRNISTSVGRAVESVAGTVMGAESARNISRHVENTVASTGTSGIELASRTIGQQAQAALQRANGEVGGGTRAPSALWNMALNATVFVSSMLAESAQSSRRRQRQQSGRLGGGYAFARHFDMDGDDVAREVGEAAAQLYLGGSVWHLDRAFSEAGRRGEGMPTSGLVRRERTYFGDVEVSEWMLHDHNPQTSMTALRELLCGRRGG